MQWRGGRCALAVDDLAPAKAIVVLSTMPAALPGAPSAVEWSDLVDRFDAGIALWQAGRAQLLVFTRGHLPWRSAARLPGEVMAEAAASGGIPGDRILLTREVMDTDGEAQAVAALLCARLGGEHMRSVILVTSAFHMRRARLLFARTGLQVTPFPVDFQGLRRWHIHDPGFAPRCGKPPKDGDRSA